ncbi:MAG: hypothetical protein HJJLKODD_02309 [Phycisphaerae bacterium]|nr:hypothetical protein [Phycisphaerae bacterium]
MNTTASVFWSHGTYRFFLGILTLLTLPAYVSAQEMSDEVRDHVRKAAGQVWLGSQVQGEDKIDPLGSGSGWFINATGLMITNNHVVDPAHSSTDPLEPFAAAATLGKIQYRVVVNGGTDQEKTYKAERLYQCRSADLAILQLYNDKGAPLDSPHYFELIPSNEVEKGMRVFAVGFPHGDQMATQKDKHAPVTIAPGNVTRIIKSPTGRIKKFFSDVEIIHGNSGGALVDSKGRCIGVNVEVGFGQGESGGIAGGQIPADVVADLLRAALGRNKITTDLGPFLHLLLNRRKEVFVPGRERLESKEIVEFPDGGLMEGEVKEQELTWATALGQVKIPLQYAGFIINDNGTARLLLDGGERLSGDASQIKFKFLNSRGQESTIEMSNVKSVLFRKPRQPVTYPNLDALIIDGEGTRLYLTDIKGDVKFKDASAGEVTLPLSDIRRVDTENFKQTIYRTDGSRLTGSFATHTIEAKLAVTGAPLKFSFEKSKRLAMRPENPFEKYSNTVSLAQKLQIEENELVVIANLLEKGDFKKSGGYLSELLDPIKFKAKPKPIQEQIQILNSEYLLQSGNYVEATKAFRNLRKAKIEGIQWYATGRYFILEQHEDGMYKGQALSDPQVFKQAISDITQSIISTTQEFIRANWKTKFTNYGDWKGIMSKSDRVEKDTRTAAQLGGNLGERTLFLIWQFQIARTWDALKLVWEEREALFKEIEQRRAQNKPLGNLVRQFEKLQEQQELILIEYASLRDQLNPIGSDDYNPGYRVDDPEAMDYLY